MSAAARTLMEVLWMNPPHPLRDGQHREHDLFDVGQWVMTSGRCWPVRQVYRALMREAWAGA
jgi:hypothetical protein